MAWLDLRRRWCVSDHILARAYHNHTTLLSFSYPSTSMPPIRTKQSQYGQPVAPNLAVHHLCPNCQTNPPNIIEEYSHGDLVSSRHQAVLTLRSAETVALFLEIESSTRVASVSTTVQLPDSC